ncbi:unnamed protein product [Albugo candida]|uniref:Uncharacterized protein n=1 Tax=Albugo candida TaxID=65357 RepID=A0A024GCQ4_9STRA|nr:unnamed protein product [Albugo candida]|eukprot:CCI44546.1 unnamed protein product [Albugo candida]
MNLPERFTFHLLIVFACCPLKSNTYGLRKLLQVVDSETSSDFVSSLRPIKTRDSYHFRPVQAIQARVQSDEPVWKDGRFVSGYYDTMKDGFVGLMDSVNLASVEGALMYVQAEGINHKVRGKEDRCRRKNNMKYIVFYHIVFAQTNETLALYQNTTNTEYGPMLPMDSGRCTPVGTKNGVDIFSEECYYINGDNNQPELGPFIGGESKESDPRAPYANNTWFSYPNTCPLQAWPNKSSSCRKSTRRGLCDMDKLPNGVDCTYNYKVLGYVALDDLVGITSMKSTSGKTYQDFAEFCRDGGIEFEATEEGKWIKGIDFWSKPQELEANRNRTISLIDLYTLMLNESFTSPIIPSKTVFNFDPLPSIDSLTKANPPCYENVKKCSEAKFGCKRDLYQQMCVICTTEKDDCQVAPKSWEYPTLKLAVGADGSTGNATHKFGDVTDIDAGHVNHASGLALISLSVYFPVLLLSSLWF